MRLLIISLMCLLVCSCNKESKHNVAVDDLTCVAKYVSPLDESIRTSLGIQSDVFNVTIPDGYAVTIWCEFYQHGILNDEISSYSVKNNPLGPEEEHLKKHYHDVSMELRHTDPDYFTGRKSTEGVWSFHGGPGHLVKMDPMKVSMRSSSDNLANQEGGIVLSEGKPTLLYYYIGAENGATEWRSRKDENIKFYDHVVCVFARLDRYPDKGGFSGSGLITSRDHPLLLGEPLSKILEKRAIEAEERHSN